MATIPEAVVKAFDLPRPLLFGTGLKGSMFEAICKEEKPPSEDTPSQQGANTGLRAHPFVMSIVSTLQTANEHHAACIQAKIASTVGLGYITEEERKAKAAARSQAGDPKAEPKSQKQIEKEATDALSKWKLSKVDEKLNPLCTHSWLDTNSDICEDFWEYGQGWLEVVRKDGKPDGEILALHHCPAPSVYINIEKNNGVNFHYEVVTEGVSQNKKFAKFGDLASFQTRMKDQVGTGVDLAKTNELIHIRRPSNKDRWYGFPDWLAAVAAIELIQCLRQYKYDFFNNRGVPEFLLFILGQKLSDPDWKLVVDALQANIGRGNSHKSLALNLTNENIKVQLEKLALEGKSEDGINDTNETYATAVVTAHGVPPLLAGIQIPGKLGASNELPNAIRAFQLLKLGTPQRVFQMRMGATLANKQLSNLGLSIEDFTHRTLLDEIDLEQMDTSARMRQTEAEAASQGRNLKDGVKD